MAVTVTVCIILVFFDPDLEDIFRRTGSHMTSNINLEFTFEEDAFWQQQTQLMSVGFEVSPHNTVRDQLARDPLSPQRDHPVHDTSVREYNDPTSSASHMANYSDDAPPMLPLHAALLVEQALVVAATDQPLPSGRSLDDDVSHVSAEIPVSNFFPPVL